MPLDLWLAFVAASTALLLISGPTVLAVLRGLTRAGGAALVGTGLVTATLRRAPA